MKFHPIDELPKLEQMRYIKYKCSICLWDTGWVSLLLARLAFSAHCQLFKHHVFSVYIRKGGDPTWR